MALQDMEPVANGVGTDHPIPDLPFIDDSHLPLDDRHALEAIGRDRGAEDMWGRTDLVQPDRGWVAFTTDPKRPDLAWVVRWHPDHGRSVVLYRDEDASSVYMTFWNRSLLFRRGGYWWDGTSWFRPRQVWDPIRGGYHERAVPAAVTVTAADMLATGGDAKAGRIWDIAEVAAGAAYAGVWLDDLAVWAGHRVERGAPSASVVNVSAPELAGEQLISIGGLAEVADIAASTLRAYVAREEGEVPEPQAIVAGRAMWSRPVAQEWAERRRSSSEGVDAALATRVGPFEMSPGLATLTARLTKVFFSHLWESGWRKRWALRWRTREAVEEIARGLSWDVAANIGRIVPLQALAATVRHAALDDIAEQHSTIPEGEEWSFYGITRPVVRMLAWLSSHDPDLGAGALREIVADAHRRFGIPASTTVNSLRTALHLDSDLDGEALNTYLDRVFAPVLAAGASGEEAEDA